MTHLNPGIIWALSLPPAAVLVYGVAPAVARTWTRAADRRAMRRVFRRDLASLNRADTFARAFGGNR